MVRGSSRVGRLLLAACMALVVSTDVTMATEAAPEAVPSEVPAAAVSAEPFDAAAATRAYLDRLSPEEKARSDAYFEGGYWIQLWGFLIGLAIAWLLLGTRLSARMRDLAARWTRRKPLQTWLYGVQYVLLSTVLGFPFAVYTGYFREHRYGLATQDFPAWLGDQAKGLAVGLVLVPLLLMALYGVFRKAPRTWWLWGSGVALLFLVVMLLIAPVYIDPLFNTYKPLEDPAVKEPILSMARSSGIDVDKVYEFDASRQTTRISANVSGFLNTMSIRLNDNLLERCSLPEIKAVMGHEMGHYVLNHVYESIVFFGVVLVGGFAFLRWAFDRLLRGREQRWGVTGIGDPAGLPLLAAIFSVYFFVLTPALNTYIRVNEAEADIYGLQTSREPDGFAEVALKLGEYRKLDPGPVEEWIFFDHPSGRARIRMAMDWKAENLGR
ncbi:MAG: M48 family metallopeptidase [Thermoanaerobaculia bacterium]